MAVSVNFYGLQRKFTRTDHIRVPLLRDTRVTDVFHYIQECYPDLPLSKDVVLVTVNSKLASMDQILNEDDKISFIPHIGGG